MGLFDKLKNIPTINELQGGFGEQLTKMMAFIDIPEVLTLRDILIDGYGENTSQIDLLLIGGKGIYVVEVKMYPDAKIYGDGKKKQWYYYKNGKKYDIYSPIEQNRSHIKHLKQFLKEFGEVPCFSVVALLCEDFKISNINANPECPDTIVLNGLLSLRKGLKMLAKGKDCVFTEEQKQAVFEYIKENQYEGKEKRLEHKSRVQELKEKKEEAVEKGQCPQCGSSLVLRKGRYGDFFGCSNFPACKYTKKC